MPGPIRYQGPRNVARRHHSGETMVLVILIAILGLAYLAFHYGRRRALARPAGLPANFHSLPSYYGYYTMLWAAVPPILVLCGWLIIEPGLLRGMIEQQLAGQLDETSANIVLVMEDVRRLASGERVLREYGPGIQQVVADYRELRYIAYACVVAVMAAVAAAGFLFARTRLVPQFRARNTVEKVVMAAMMFSACVAILTTVGIVLSLLFEAVLFFNKYPFFDFLFGLTWSPQAALRADQVGSGEGTFGAIPLLAGTAMISLIAMIVAVPIGLMAAIYLAEYASPRMRAPAKPILEILAGIPTVVYGFFAAITVAPLFSDIGSWASIPTSPDSALAAGVVMGIMIIPFISSLSDDVINAVPQSMRDGSYALGATQSETIRKVLMPAALPGIMGAVLLAASRAIGETMIVVMAAGLVANLTANPFEAVTTVTVQIATLLVGDQEFDSAKTLSVFALGLLLFVVTLILNLIALRIVRKYREQYE